MWYFEIMMKVDVIWGKVFAIEDQLYLKPFPYGQQPFNLGSWAQKLKPISKGNDFEVLDPRPEIKIHAT